VARVYSLLGSNAITGTIPTEMGQMQALRYMALHDMDLTGSMPTELALLTAVTYL
jgi:hypothetical protein